MNNGNVTDERICRIIGSALPKSATRAGITPSMALKRDLGIDSVGLMSVVFFLEEEIGIDAFAYVQDFIAAEHVSDIIEIVHQGS